MRGTFKVLAVGALTGILLAGTVGLAGAPGQTGLAVLLLILAFTAATGAVHAIGFAIVDDLKDRRVGRGRPLTALGLFLLAALLMAMVVGAGG